MPAIPLRVILQAEEATKQARDVLGRFQNFEPVMRGPVRRLVRSAIVQQFRTRGRFGGTPWAPLAESTIKRKRRFGQRMEPMRRTDKLYRSLVYRENAVETIKPGLYELKTLVRYAKYHQSTAPRPSGLPRRPVIPDQLPPSMIEDLRNILKGYLVTGTIAE